MDDNKRLRVCCWHVADLDGACSGAIFKRVAEIKGWENTKLFPYNYGYALPLDEWKGAEIYFLDCTPSPIATWAPKLAAIADVYVCDHHATALNDPAFQQFLSKGLSRDGKDSGCALAWEFWRHDLGPMPKIVRLLSTYDVWDNKDKKQWESTIMPMQYGMKAQITDPMLPESNVIWNKVFDDDDAFYLRMLDQGHTIYQYEKKSLAIHAKGAFEAKFADKRAICLNTCNKSSQSFEAVFDPAKHDCMLAFNCKPNQNGVMEFNISLYAVDPHVDCGEIMKRYGGGGHNSAAGCRVKSITYKNGVLSFD